MTVRAEHSDAGWREIASDSRLHESLLQKPEMIMIKLDINKENLNLSLHYQILA